MQTLVTGLIALMLMVMTAQVPASAGSDTVSYQPGIVETAVAKGETVLLHYKSTW